MAFRLTGENLGDVYELLRKTPPFNKWKLPHSSSGEIKFRVKGLEKGCLGDYVYEGGKHAIEANSRYFSSLDERLFHLIAHEMIHLRQQLLRPDRSLPKNPHGKDFKEMKKQICRWHIWDELVFP